MVLYWIDDVRCNFFVTGVHNSSAHSVGGPSRYVILSDQLPVHYKLDSVITGAYISLYKQGSADNTELARQSVQDVLNGEYITYNNRVLYYC